MITGTIAGLAALALFATVCQVKPYTHVWVLFGAAGALIGSFLGSFF